MSDSNSVFFLVYVIRGYQQDIRLIPVSSTSTFLLTFSQSLCMLTSDYCRLVDMPQVKETACTLCGTTSIHVIHIDCMDIQYMYNENPCNKLSSPPPPLNES